MWFDRETVALLRTTLDRAWASLPPSEQATTSPAVLADRLIVERGPPSLSLRLVPSWKSAPSFLVVQ
jgi:hypothetical protein